jgi:hypothetical protein
MYVGSTGCRKGAGTLFLCLRATGETKKYICLSSNSFRVARFLSMQDWENVTNDQKIYQIAIK